MVLAWLNNGLIVVWHERKGKYKLKHTQTKANTNDKQIYHKMIYYHDCFPPTKTLFALANKTKLNLCVKRIGREYFLLSE